MMKHLILIILVFNSFELSNPFSADTEDLPSKLRSSMQNFEVQMDELFNFMDFLVLTDVFKNSKKTEIVNDLIISLRLKQEPSSNSEWVKKISDEDAHELEKIYKELDTVGHQIKTKIDPFVAHSFFKDALELFELIPKIRDMFSFLTDLNGFLTEAKNNEFLQKELWMLVKTMKRIEKSTKLQNFHHSVQFTIDNLISLTDRKGTPFKSLKKAEKTCFRISRKDEVSKRLCLLDILNAIQIPVISSKFKTWKDVMKHMYKAENYLKIFKYLSRFDQAKVNSNTINLLDNTVKTFFESINKTDINWDDYSRFRSLLNKFEDEAYGSMYSCLNVFSILDNFLIKILSLQDKYKSAPVRNSTSTLKIVQKVENLYILKNEFEKISDFLSNPHIKFGTKEVLSEEFFFSGIMERLQLFQYFPVEMLIDGIGSMSIVKRGFQTLHNLFEAKDGKADVHEVQKDLLRMEEIVYYTENQLDTMKSSASWGINLNNAIDYIKPVFNHLLENFYELKLIDLDEDVVYKVTDSFDEIKPVMKTFAKLENKYNSKSMFLMDEEELDELFEIQRETTKKSKTVMSDAVSTITEIRSIVKDGYYKIKKSVESSDGVAIVKSMKLDPPVQISLSLVREVSKYSSNFSLSKDLPKISDFEENLENLKQGLKYFEVIKMDHIKHFQKTFESFVLFLYSDTKLVAETPQMEKLKKEHVDIKNKMLEGKEKYLGIINTAIKIADDKEKYGNKFDSFFESIPALQTSSQFNRNPLISTEYRKRKEFLESFKVEIFRGTVELASLVIFPKIPDGSNFYESFSRFDEIISELWKFDNWTDSFFLDDLYELMDIGSLDNLTDWEEGDEKQFYFGEFRSDITKFVEEILQKRINCSKPEDIIYAACREASERCRQDLISYGDSAEDFSKFEIFHFKWSKIRFGHEVWKMSPFYFGLTSLLSFGLISFVVYVSAWYTWILYSDVSSKCSYIIKDKCFFTPFKQDDDYEPNPFFTACDQEFSLIRSDYDYTTFVNTAEFPNIKSKIPLIEENSVMVESIIMHASKIYLLRKVYIASEMPVRENCEHFFDMIIQEKSSVIIQISTKEDNCLNLSKIESVGKYKVKVTREETKIKYLERFKITLVDETSKREFSFYLLHIFGWPESLTPLNISTILDTMELSMELTEKGASILVCCPDGCSRSMTYISCIHIRDIIESQKMAYFVDIISQMRRLRFGAVNTVSEYATIWMITMLWRTRVDESKNEHIYRRLRELFLADLALLNNKSKMTKPVHAEIFPSVYKNKTDEGVDV